MSVPNFANAYFRGVKEEITQGIVKGLRPGPTLEESRQELAEAISKVIAIILRKNYGPLVNVIAEPKIVELLVIFERSLVSTRGDLTMVIQEIWDRIFDYSKTK